MKVALYLIKLKLIEVDEISCLGRSIFVVVRVRVELCYE